MILPPFEVKSEPGDAMENETEAVVIPTVVPDVIATDGVG